MIYITYMVWVILEILVIVLACLAVMLVYKFVGEGLQRYYYRWKDKRVLERCWKKHEIRIQQQRKRELHRKERERYPLFYWRELIEEKLEDVE